MRTDKEIMKDQREEIARLRIIRDFLKDWVSSQAHAIYLLHEQDEEGEESG